MAIVHVVYQVNDFDVVCIVVIVGVVQWWWGTSRGDMTLSGSGVVHGTGVGSIGSRTGDRLWAVG